MVVVGEIEARAEVVQPAPWPELGGRPTAVVLAVQCAAVLGLIAVVQLAWLALLAYELYVILLV